MTRYTKGSILQFTPVTEPTFARFDSHGDVWTEQVLGWGIVVSWIRGHEDGESGADTETHVEPVLISSEDGSPELLSDYLQHRDDLSYKGIVRSV